jgi:subtilisin family serine protease
MNTTRRTALFAVLFTVSLTVLHAEFPPDQQRERQAIVERLNVTAWHDAGRRGKGVKVAVLDTGFRGYRDQLGKALPEAVTAKAFRTDGKLESRDSQHGILCGEVVHALAPESDLIFANWEPDQPTTFLDAVRWARQQGAKVISCSVIMPTWSDNEGHGAMHRQLTKLLGDDCLLFAAAGNVAERHWAGTFTADGDEWHQWKRGDRENQLVPWEMERVSVEMMWQGATRYRLEVLDDNGKPIAVGGEGRDADHAWTTARFVPEPGRTYNVRVQRVAGTAGRFHLVVLGANIEHSDSRGSVAFPADGAEVVGVGAVTTDDQRQPYSSCGADAGLAKPDLVAAVPFPSVWRERPFGGTSAATPQAAAMAAILWASNPEFTASQVRAALVKAARRLGESAHDPETGYGQVRLPGR